MSAVRWHRLNETFHSAIALGPDACAAFLSREGGDDESLRREAEALVDAHEQAERDSEALEHLGRSLGDAAGAAVTGATSDPTGWSRDRARRYGRRVAGPTRRRLIPAERGDPADGRMRARMRVAPGQNSWTVDVIVMLLGLPASYIAGKAK